MIYKTVYTSSAEKDLAALPKAISKRILNKISEYTHLKTPLKKARKLKGIVIPTYRFRIEDYRAIFRLDPKTKKLVILVVLKIAHRKEIY